MNGYMDMDKRLERIERLQRAGVTFLDASTAYIGDEVSVGEGSVVYPNVYIDGKTVIGRNTVLHFGCVLTDTRVGDDCVLRYVTANAATIGDRVTIGPYVNLRPASVIGDDCRIGDFVEVKNSTVGAMSKLPHLSYVGDSDIGERVNVGCGTVFVNYDGHHKHRCTVGDDVFIGCNTNLVAPVTLEDNTYTAAGSTITRDVGSGELAVARSRQVNIAGWVERHRKRCTSS
ncbi:MAG: DapH/DapD/GlmU-related protein [Clostridia bacterium]|nr:DapH/DapD/GlmU-related protein [Clostridia bacterium]